MKRRKFAKGTIRSGQINFAIGRLKGAAAMVVTSMHQIARDYPGLDQELYDEAMVLARKLQDLHYALKRRRSSVKN